MGRNCLTCLKIGHKTKNCPMAIVCYRCRKSGHMARDCQDPIYKKRLNQIHIKDITNSAVPNSNKLMQTTLDLINKYCGDRCFKCNGFGHLSHDCKAQVTFTAKCQQQQQQTYMMASNQSHSLMHQQSAPMPKIIDHMPQARHVDPPILLQSGEEKYHVVVNKNAHVHSIISVFVCFFIIVSIFHFLFY